MVTVGNIRPHHRNPTDRVRDTWSTEFNDNFDTIVRKIVKVIKAEAMDQFTVAYNNGYGEKPNAKLPYDHTQLIDIKTVYKILKKANVTEDKRAPFKEWYRESGEQSSEFIDKLLYRLTERVAQILPRKLPQKFPNMKIESNLSWYGKKYHVKTSMWVRHPHPVPGRITREQKKWNAKFDKHLDVTASKVSEALIEKVRANLTERTDENPYAQLPTEKTVEKYDLYFMNAIQLIADAIPKDERTSPFKYWIKNSKELVTSDADFSYFKEKLMLLFNEVNRQLRDARKDLKSEGIYLKPYLKASKKYRYLELTFHTIIKKQRPLHVRFK